VAPTRVVKVGGSLFDWPGLRGRLRDWLAEQSPAVAVLIAGGGKLADAVRKADRTHQLGNEAAHRLAIRTMSVTARLLAELLDVGAVVDNWEELRQRIGNGCAPALLLFDVQSWMLKRDEKARRAPLPHTWDVTSDSIAAALAIELQANELVLLKSSSPPPTANLDELCAAGYVDRSFSDLANDVRKTRFINLKRSDFGERGT
jgi:aspartokinase-like uncharacterized kinase